MNMIKRIFNFYYEGFKNMSKWAKTLWVIIFIKLFIMFAVLKVFFFNNHMGDLKTDQDKSEYVIEQLTNTKKTDNGTH